MPVRLPSDLRGKVPHDVEVFLRDLADAVNRMEPVVVAAPGEARVSAAASATAASQQQQIDELRMLVQTLTPRAEESSETPIPGQPSLPPTPTPGNPNPGGPALGIVGAGSAMPTVALPSLFSVVGGYANAHPAELAASCQESGGNWAFMDGVVAALMAADARVGFNGKRGDTGDPSQDAVSYYHGILPATLGSPDVYVIDIIGGHCGPNPTPTWTNVTSASARGAYMPTR